MVCVVILAFSFCLAAEKSPKTNGEQTEPPRFTTIVKEKDGGPTQLGELVVQTQEEMDSLVGKVTSGELKRKLAAVKIDFDKETVVAVALKNSSILGDAYEGESGIQNVTIKDGEAIVEHNTIYSDHQDTKPHHRVHFVKFLKCKKVTFKVTNKAYAG